MKLKDIRDSYYQYSKKTSDILRYLSLAGIGVIWIFRVQSGNIFSLPKQLILPIFLLILSLVLDFLQYVAGSIIWSTYNRLLEKRGVKEEDDFMAPRKLNWLTLFFFWTKPIPTVIAYFLILSYLIQCMSF